jgi:hypothetical protein
MMKKAVLLACAALTGVSVAFGGLISEEPGEVSVSGQYWMPTSVEDLFDFGLGANVSYREWFRFPWGAGVNLGLGWWQVNEDSKGFKYGALTDYEGDVMTIPLGASLYFNLIDWDNWNVILGTGLQYMFVDSSVSVFNNEEAVKRRQDVDIGGALLWNIGGEYEYMVAENIYVVGGLGYQIDLVKADTDYDGGSLRDTSFEAFYLQLGCKMLF